MTATLINLGINLKDAGKIDQGIERLQEALARTTHPATQLVIGGHLLEAFVHRFDSERMRAEVERYLGQLRKVHSRPSGDLAEGLTVAARACLALKLMSEAEALLRESAEIQSMVPVDDWPKAVTVFSLAAAISAQANSDVTYTELVTGFDKLENCRDAIPVHVRRKHLALALQQLIEAATALGKKADSDRWKSALDELEN